MKEYIWKPKPREDGDHPFEGHVLIQVPKYRERLCIIKELNFQVSEDGQAKVNPSQLDSAGKLIEVAEKHVKEIDLVRKDDQMEFKTFEDLEYDKDGSEVINEIANSILEGVRLEKN